MPRGRSATFLLFFFFSLISRVLSSPLVAAVVPVCVSHIVDALPSLTSVSVEVVALAQP